MLKYTAHELFRVRDSAISGLSTARCPILLSAPLIDTWLRTPLTFVRLPDTRRLLLPNMANPGAATLRHFGRHRYLCDGGCVLMLLAFTVRLIVRYSTDFIENSSFAAFYWARYLSGTKSFPKACSLYKRRIL